MGVLNFASYLRRNPILLESFDHHEVPDEALFVIDLKAWLYDLYRTIKQPNDLNTPCRCDYKQLKAAAALFCHAFNNFQLLFICDGPRDSLHDGSKLATWLERSRAEAQDMQKTAVLAGLGGCPVLLPIMAVQMMLRWLAKEGYDVLSCPGEADATIVHYFHTRDAFAIISQDTDFCFYEDVRYIPLSTLCTQPQLTGGTIIHTARLRQRLGLTMPQMLTLAAVAGNDVTGPVLRLQNTHSQLRVQNRTRGANIDKLIKLVKTTGSRSRLVETHKALATKACRNVLDLSDTGYTVPTSVSTPQVSPEDWGTVVNRAERWFEPVMVEEPRWHAGYFWAGIAALEHCNEVQHRWFDSKGQSHTLLIKPTTIQGTSSDKLRQVFQLPDEIEISFCSVFRHVCTVIAPAIIKSADAFLGSMSQSETANTPAWTDMDLKLRQRRIGHFVGLLKLAWHVVNAFHLCGLAQAIADVRLDDICVKTFCTALRC
eukprot:m.150177 g.150177  ORF g.150177 m.150177 type:complete len:485 (-) comp16311_c1_seq1:1404-2858(-)